MNNNPITIDQAAEKYQVSRSWFYEHTRQRHSVKNPIPCVPVGKHIRFYPDELDQWIRNRGGSLKTSDIYKVSFTKG